MLTGSLKRIIWLFPVVFLIHDTEELVFIESWLKNYGGALSEKVDFGGFLLNKMVWTTPRFAIAVAVLFALICLVCYHATRPNATAKDRKWFVIAVTALFLNVFTHLAQAVLFQSYTPGVATAVAVILPYTLYVYGRLRKEGWVSAAFVRSIWSVAGIIMALSIVGTAVF